MTRHKPDCTPCTVATVTVCLVITWPAPTVRSHPAQDASRAAPTVVFYHADHLGSTNITTDAAGVVVSETEYYPFGAPRHEVTGIQGGSDPRYRFSDKERDDESGLHYFEARYYQAVIGRFISFDNGARRVEATGSYAYAMNNPQRYVDPGGTDPAPKETSVGDDVIAIAEGTAAGVPKMLKDTNAAAKGIANGKGAAFISPDPDKRTEAAEGFAGDVGKAFAEKGVGKLLDEMGEHANIGVLIALGGTYAGLAVGLAMADTDLPLPSPGIPVSDQFELKPSIDLTTMNGAEDKYVPGFGLRGTFKAGPVTQYVQGGYNPDKGVSASAGFNVKLPIGKVGASVRSEDGGGFNAGAMLTIAP